MSNIVLCNKLDEIKHIIHNRFKVSPFQATHIKHVAPLGMIHISIKRGVFLCPTKRLIYSTEVQIYLYALFEYGLTDHALFHRLSNNITQNLRVDLIAFRFSPFFLWLF